MIRIIITLLLILAGIATMYLIPGLAGAFIGSLVFVFALFLWVVPWTGFRRNKQQLDPTQKRISNTLLGIGLGMIGGLVAVILLPPTYFWLLAALITLAAIIWWIRN